MLTFAAKNDVLEYADHNGYFAIFEGQGGTLQNIYSGQVFPFFLEGKIFSKEKAKHTKIIISLSGKAQAGKNTTATLITKILNNMQSSIKVREFSFAAYLKQMAKEQFGWNGDKTLYPEEVRTKGRNLLINLAKVYRDLDEDFWAKNLVNRIEQTMLGATAECTKELWIITDTRYPNEIKLLRDLESRYSEELKLYCWKLTRPQELNIDSPSEKALDNFLCWDLTIPNDGSLQLLETTLRYKLTSIGVI